MKIPSLKKIKILGPQITSSFAFTKEGFKTEKKNIFFFVQLIFFVGVLLFLAHEGWGQDKRSQRKITKALAEKQLRVWTEEIL